MAVSQVLIRPPLSKKSFPVRRVGKKKPVGRSGMYRGGGGGGSKKKNFFENRK